MRFQKLRLIVLMGSMGMMRAQTSEVSPPVSGQPVVQSKLTRPIRVSGGVMAKNLLTKVMPVYLEEARRAHVGGTVVMRAIIGEDGHIRSASIISGAAILQQPYMDAVSQWAYKAYLLNGKPVEVETTIMIDIQVNGGPR